MAQDFPCSGRSGEAAGQAWFLSFTNLERCHKEPAKKEGEAEPWQSQKKGLCRDQSSSSKGKMGTRENILASYGLNVEKSPEKETLVVSSSEEGSCAETPVSGSGGSFFRPAAFVHEARFTWWHCGVGLHERRVCWFFWNSNGPIPLLGNCLKFLIGPECSWSGSISKVQSKGQRPSPRALPREKQELRPRH